MIQTSPRAYIGCRTTAQRRAIGRGLTRWETDSLPWRSTGLAEAENPSYLLLDPERGVLWTVHGDFGSCSAYRLADGLELISRLDLQGRNPVHLALADRDTLLVANYATGGVAHVVINPDGSFRELREVLPLPGEPGPDPEQQGASHPHQILVDADAGVIWVPDKGLDTVFGLRLDTHRLRIVSTLRCPPGSGPRHAVRHPDLPILYLAEELGSALSWHTVDEGRLRTLGRLSTVTTRDAGNTAAAIVLAPDARALFVTNRGHDSIACYRLDAEGTPAFAGETPSGVSCPRFATLSPDGQGLVVAGETSHTIVRLDLHADATLGDPVPVAETGSPTCVVFDPRPPLWTTPFSTSGDLA